MTTSTARPNWLLTHLIRNGHLTESGLSRRAKVRTCDRCGGVALVGLDDDICAFEVAADPRPLSALGEAMALLEHRRSFELVKTQRGYQLERRTSDSIESRPAGATPRADVLAEHRCNSLEPATALLAETSFPEHRRSAHAYKEPPF